MPESTMIYVTHDQVEAMTLASRIVVLDALKDNGHKYSIAQVGSPLELYETPNSEFVARFIGSPAMTLLEGEIVETGATTTIRTVQGGGTVTSTIPSKARGQGRQGEYRHPPRRRRGNRGRRLRLRRRRGGRGAPWRGHPPLFRARHARCRPGHRQAARHPPEPAAARPSA